MALQGNYNPQSGGKGLTLQGSSPKLQNTLTLGQLQPTILGSQLQPTVAPGLQQTVSAPAQQYYAPATGSTGRASGSGGGSAGNARALLTSQNNAYYDDQINLANSALGRIGNQRNIGLENINSNTNSALNSLLSSNAKAVRDYQITKQNTIDDNVQARAKVDANVARQSRGLSNLLGNSSSAALFAAPTAVGRQGNEQLTNIGTSFGRNLTSLLNADKDRESQFEANQNDINRQKEIAINDLNAGLMNSEANINEQLAGLQLQKAQAGGQSYEQARGSAAPYTTRVQNLLGQIDSLGRNPTINAKSVSFAAPNLDAYTANSANIALGARTPAQALTGQYFGLLDDRRKQSV